MKKSRLTVIIIFSIAIFCSQLVILSLLFMSATCTLIHQVPIPIFLQQIVPQVLPQHNPNYNFAYNVNEPLTGDIKDQQESRRGDTVVGQYSLIQPDGVRRTVDYRADDVRGFRATVNNERQNERQIENSDEQRDIDERRAITHPQIPQMQISTPLPALSRTSIMQTFESSRPVQYQNNLWD